MADIFELEKRVANKLKKSESLEQYIRQAAPPMSTWSRFKDSWLQFVDENDFLTSEELTYVIWQMLNREWSNGKKRKDT